MSIANPYLYGKDPRNTAHARMKRQASIASITTACVLIAAKLAAYLTTGSVSLLSSLMDSTFDAMASVVTLISIVHAATPADANHRYGHGKVEAVGALCQAIFIFGSAILLFILGVQRILHPEEVRTPVAAMGVMVLSIALTAALIVFQKHVIRKTESLAVSADRLHYQGDLMMNMCVLASIGLTAYTGWVYFDPLFALGVALTLLRGSYKIAEEAFDVLLDKELPDDTRQKIIDTVMQEPVIHGVHDLRTRHAGERVFIEFHIEVDPLMPMKSVHNVMDTVEARLFEAFPKAEVLIHPEPAGLDDHRIDARIAE